MNCIHNMSFDEANQHLQISEKYFSSEVETAFNTIRKILLESYPFFSSVMPRVSWLFIRDLVKLRLANKKNIMAIHSILQEIEILEGFSDNRSHTGKENKFKGEYLQGLYKKHYVSDESHVFFNTIQLISKNKNKKLAFEEKIRSDFQKKDNISIIEAFTAPVEEVFNITIDRFSREKEGIHRDFITGEWIVFHKEGNKNYYLCLHEHDKNDRIKGEEITNFSKKDFPNLKIIR